MAHDTPLPADVAAALERGDAIEAVKLLRARGGLGLGEAMTAIARHAVTQPRRPAPGSAPATLSAAARQALDSGNKIEAIKRVREETGLDLPQARAAVEAAAPSTASRAGVAVRAAKPFASPAPYHRPRNGLAPGEVPRGHGGLWLALALALMVGLLLYRHFSG